MTWVASLQVAAVRRAGYRDYHSGIGLHTPQSVHDGTAAAIRAHRQQVLDAAYAARPDRFRRPPQAPKLPASAWINQPRPTIESQEDTAASIHAA